MIPFFVGAGLMLVVALLIGLLYILARLNIFFTIVQEGRAKAIKRWGKFHHLVMTYREHAFDQNWNVLSLAEKEKEGIILRSTGLQLFGGIHWVGIPLIATIHDYDFRWTSFRQKKDEKTEKLKEFIESREEHIDYILVQDDVYYTLIDSAEAKGMVPLNVELLLTICVSNPYKALFKIEEWLEATLNRVKPAVRQYIADNSYEDLIQKKEEQQQNEDPILKSTGLSKDIEEEYGVRIKKLGFVSIEPVGERGVNFVEAASRKYVAEKNREATIVAADAEKQRLEKVAEGEANRIDRIYKTINAQPNGVTLRAIEAVSEAGKGDGNWVIPFGSLGSIFEKTILKPEEQKPKPIQPGGEKE